MSRIVLSLLVDNTAGVLSRVAGLFSRRGYNIESLTVGVTADPRYSRMTVVSLGDHQVLEQIQKQLGKLEDVHDIKELREGHSVYRELMLVKVRANANQRMAINAISEIFRASIVDVGKDSVTVMLTGDQSKQDALINLLEDYEILELARTGLTGLSRGADDIRYFKSQPWAFTDTEMIGFFAELDGDDKIRLQEDELSEAGWYTREEIPDDARLISVGTEMKMYFKYGPDWEKKWQEHQK